jgi:lysophospholipase L1-like esterase
MTILSWATFRDDGGVALSNLGVVGSQLQHFARTDDALLAAEFQAYAPDLIVLAFGTNEGFVPRFDSRAYEAVLRAQIMRLRSLAPNAPILLLGAPDALSRNPALRANADDPPLDCPGTDNAALFAPPALAQVRAVQRKVAGELNIAFWDWQARMGGGCSARRWAEAPLPLMRPDHVHFRWMGAQMLAAALQADLDTAAKD